MGENILAILLLLIVSIIILGFLLIPITSITFYIYIILSQWRKVTVPLCYISGRMENLIPRTKRKWIKNNGTWLDMQFDFKEEKIKSIRSEELFYSPSGSTVYLISKGWELDMDKLKCHLVIIKEGPYYIFGKYLGKIYSAFLDPSDVKSRITKILLETGYCRKDVDDFVSDLKLGRKMPGTIYLINTGLGETEIFSLISPAQLVGFLRYSLPGKNQNLKSTSYGYT